MANISKHSYIVMKDRNISCSSCILFTFLVLRILIAYNDAVGGMFWNKNGVVDLIFFSFLMVMTILAMQIGKKNKKTEGRIYIILFILIVLFEMVTRWQFGQSMRWNSGSFGGTVFRAYTFMAIIVGLMFYLVPGIKLLLYKEQQLISSDRANIKG